MKWVQDLVFVVTYHCTNHTFLNSVQDNCLPPVILKQIGADKDWKQRKYFWEKQPFVTKEGTEKKRGGRWCQSHSIPSVGCFCLVFFLKLWIYFLSKFGMNSDCHTNDKCANRSLRKQRKIALTWTAVSPLQTVVRSPDEMLPLKTTKQNSITNIKLSWQNFWQTPNKFANVYFSLKFGSV